jgi:hypothetical protein
MSDYIFMVNVGDSITNEVTLTRLIQNRRERTNKFLNFKVGLYTQKLESTLWVKLDEVEFDDNTIQLRSSDYDLAVGQLVVIVRCNINFNLEGELSELPRPFDRNSGPDLINFRANIAFIKGDAKSSYQGDFPYNMSKVKGTFLAFDHLVGPKNKIVKTKFILVNIHSKSLNQKRFFNLYMASSDSKERLLNSCYTHNSVAILDDVNKYGSPSLFYSKDTLGIPIFISFTDGKNPFISVEHSHPPSEYFWGENKFRGQSVVKSKWFSLLK